MMELPDDVRKADFQHWAKTPHWTAHEAVALSLGAEPEDIQDEYSDRKSGMLPRGRNDDWESKFFKRRDLLDRCQQEEVFGGCFASKRLNPRAFLLWAEKLGIECAPELIEAVNSQPALKNSLDEHPKKPHEPEEERGSAKTRKLKTREMIIAAWARGLGFDPNKHNNAIGKMLKAIEKGDGTISEQSLRDIVNDGWDSLSPPARPLSLTSVDLR